MLPQLAQGDANKIWVIPSELTHALGRLTDKVLPAARRTTAEVAGPVIGDHPAAALPMSTADAAKADRQHRLRRARRLVVSVFVLRHVMKRGWPLHHANFWLVGLAAVLLLGAYSAKAWGWRHLFLAATGLPP